MPKAWPIPHLGANDSFVAAAGRTVLTRAAEVAACMPDVLARLGAPSLFPAGHDPAEALHDLRVALRRLRAAMSAYRDAFPPGSWEHLRAEVRELFGPTSALRDIDVERERLQTLRGAAPEEARPGLDLLLGQVGIRHDTALADAERALRTFATADVLARIGAVVEASTEITAAEQGVAALLTPNAGLPSPVLDLTEQGQVPSA